MILRRFGVDNEISSEIETVRARQRGVEASTDCQAITSTTTGEAERYGGEEGQESGESTSIPTYNVPCGRGHL